MQKYKMAKIDAAKLGSVKKRKITMDDEKAEDAVSNIVKNVNAMGKHKKGKKYSLDLGL
jgi:hypothetical protein